MEMSDMKLKEEVVEGREAPVLQPLQDGAKSVFDGFELPTGYLDENNQNHRSVIVREITGVEEDIMASRKMPIHMRMNKLIENCVLSIGSFKQSMMGWDRVIKSLTASDRLFLILKIRTVSLGALFSFKTQCESCEKYSQQTVSLDDFVVSGIPNPMMRVWKGTLPRSGWTYTAKVQTGFDEDTLAKNKDESNLMTLAMMARLVELNGKQPVQMSDLKSMSLADRQYLREDFEKHEGDIDNEIDIACPHCGHEFKGSVEIASPNFFFPSGTSKP